MTYVPILGAKQFQFPCWVIFGNVYLNWFLLILQTAKISTKKKVVLTVFKIVGCNFLWPWIC